MPPEPTYLQPTHFIDSDAPTIREFARDVIKGAQDGLERAVALYRAVRDRVLYDPYVDITNPRCYRASDVLALGRAYCVGKACLLAAAARAAGIPARVGYADVRNHMTSPRLYALLGTDVFLWHSYADLYVDGRWVKATPAFNSSLCDRLGLHVLEFDGCSDSLFQQFDRAGNRHMEYVSHRGTFADVPFEEIVADFRTHYPALVAKAGLSGDFQAEAVEA
jgi:transglutaminase-like putative cysteine protease